MKRKRERVTLELTLEDGKKAVADILMLKTGRLFWDEHVTRLPYPGIGRARGRPPVDQYYVGTPAVLALVRNYHEGVAELVITGARGLGKTSDLKAVACAVYKAVYLGALPDRLVCIWNMEAAVDDLVAVVRNALLFAYLFPKTVRDATAEVTGKGECSGVKENMSSMEADFARVKESIMKVKEVPADQGVFDKINQISSMDDAVRFVRERKALGEVFSFFVDSWELLEDEASRSEQRALVQTKLGGLLLEGKIAWKTASATSTLATSSESVYVKRDAFNEAQYTAYATHSILHKLKDVQDDIDYYTGRVPWLLDILRECFELLNKKKDTERWDSFRKCLGESGKFYFPYLMILDVREEQDEASLILDNWETVKQLFVGHKAFSNIRNRLNRIAVPQPCYSLEDMGALDGTFFISGSPATSQTSRYLSPFLHKFYTTELTRLGSL